MPLKMRRDDLFTKEDFEALVTAAAHQCKKCRILDGELSVSRIRRAARKMKGRGGLDLLILDYDELIEAEDSELLRASPGRVDVLANRRSPSKAFRFPSKTRNARSSSERCRARV